MNKIKKHIEKMVSPISEEKKEIIEGRRIAGNFSIGKTSYIILSGLVYVDVLMNEDIYNLLEFDNFIINDF